MPRQTKESDTHHVHCRGEHRNGQTNEAPQSSVAVGNWLILNRSSTQTGFEWVNGLRLDKRADHREEVQAINGFACVTNGGLATSAASLQRSALETRLD
jgi:hypothetical protein